MYELFLILMFGLTIIMESMRRMQAFAFFVSIIIYFLYEMSMMDLITFKLSILLLMLISAMFFIVATIREEQ